VADGDVGVSVLLPPLSQLAAIKLVTPSNSTASRRFIRPAPLHDAYLVDIAIAHA